jgi:hypothetical protein
MIQYVHHRSSIYDPIGNDWLSVTDKMLDKFRIDLTQISKFNSVDSLRTMPTPVTPSPLSAVKIVPLFYHLNVRSICSSVVSNVTSLLFLPQRTKRIMSNGTIPLQT